uniref:YTH domain-containing family protein n=1 Tax=Leersia perrieri TaxID=77586 RepID=A0A0D9WVZ5_9ORYZ
MGPRGSSPSPTTLINNSTWPRLPPPRRRQVAAAAAAASPRARAPLLMEAPAKSVAVADGNPKPAAETPRMEDYKDAAMYYGAYPAYLYGGYGGWGEYSTYLSHDGAETPTAGAYGDMYYGYSPYGYSTSGHDGQMYGSQHYQYQSTTYNKQQNATGKPSNNGKTESLAALPQGDQKLPSGNRSLTTSNSKSKGQSKNQNSYPHLMGLQTPTSPLGPPSIYSASGMYGYNGGSYGSGLWYGSHLYGSGLYGGWNALSDGKYNSRGRGNGSYGYVNGNLDGFNELRRGPRSDLFNNKQGVGATVAPVKGQELPASDSSLAVMKDQYNQADFVETYSDAKFFIIKSYSEDDVHKSIKYNVWASTSNGNKKLDAAYQEAKEKSSDSSVFLLFSVNASGQFVGLAEMVGRVDFNKTLEHWQQDKWTGCFPVKWHIVKDVPNSLLKHIILENNENKPVTNCRDTHEVKLEHGLQVLKIFKDHVCKTSLLDDFGFYDNREKMMQERKAKHQQLKKVVDEKLLNAVDSENTLLTVKSKLQETNEVEIDALNKDPQGKAGQVDGKENSVLTVAVNGVTPEDVQLTNEMLADLKACTEFLMDTDFVKGTAIMSNSFGACSEIQQELLLTFFDC